MQQPTSGGHPIKGLDRGLTTPYSKNIILHRPSGFNIFFGMTQATENGHEN
jgi:hypothetical protein